ncbi:NAD(P)-dependent oxidoreductase [Actinopolymorpha pittospori]
MHIVVAGASGRTGGLVVDSALRAGHRVTALVRDARRYTAPAGVAVHETTVTADRELTLPEGTEAVISALGMRSPRDPGPVCAPGAENLLAAMRRGSASRFLAISAAPVLTAGVGEPWWYRRVIRPAVRRSSEPVYADLEEMERLIRASDTSIAWTIVRPGYLVDKPATDYLLIPEANATSSVCRQDLADALVALLAEESAVGRSFGLRRGHRSRGAGEAADD